MHFDIKGFDISGTFFDRNKTQDIECIDIVGEKGVSERNSIVEIQCYFSIKRTPKCYSC